MPPMLLYAVILFTVALVLYTISVWSERLQCQLKTWHLVVFGLGVFADAMATWLTIEFVGAIVFTPHALFGFTSLFLMALHFISSGRSRYMLVTGKPACVSFIALACWYGQCGCCPTSPVLSVVYRSSPDRNKNDKGVRPTAVPVNHNKKA